MNKKIILLVTIFIIVSLGLMGGYYFSKEDITQKINSSSSTLEVSESVLTVESQISSFPISQSSINQGVVKASLEKLSLGNFKNKFFIGYAEDEDQAIARTLSPERLKVILKPMSRFDSDRMKDQAISGNILYSLAIDSERFETHYIAGKINDNDELEIVVYVDEEAYKDKNKAKEKFYSDKVLSAIFFTFQRPPISDLGIPISVFYEKLGEFTTPIFNESSTSLLIYSLNKLLRLDFTANAQCAGDYLCGNRVQDPGTCSISGNACDEPGDCLGAGEVCNLPAPRCDYRFAVPRLCSDVNPPSECRTPCASGCIAGGACNWVVPPPPPVCNNNGTCDTGEDNSNCPGDCSAPPVGWGACGSCSPSGCPGGQGQTCPVGDVGCNPSGCTCNPASCGGNGSPPPPPPTCSIDSLTPTTMYIGERTNIVANTRWGYLNDPGRLIFGAGYPTPNSVFCLTTSSTGAQLSCGTRQDNSPVYMTIGTVAYQPGTYNINMDMQVEDGSGTVTGSCTRTLSVTALAPPAWFQVRGAGDVIVNGALESRIPNACTLAEGSGNCRDEFIVEDTNSGLPGILITPSTAVNPVLKLTGAGFANIGKPVAEGGFGPAWVARPGTVTTSYNYSYFESLASGKTFFNNPDGLLQNIDLDTTQADQIPYRDTDGYIWIKATGNTMIGNNPGNAPLNVANRKIVVFIDGNLTIDGAVNIGNNGFAAFIVSGNITVSPTVGASNNSSTAANIAGIYWADGQFATGTTGINDDKRLNLYGSFAALGTGFTDAFLLQRDLNDTDNKTIPAETFTFAPEYMVRFPQTLSDKHLVWREIAP